ncbi:MAG: hypothetical protein HYX29_00120 [Solirubrobacterales bacterium]|nr:hypothetical protein [Solirubrobacterales bacterium]
MSSFREPVIGDEHDLETYGRPSDQRGGVRTSLQPRAHASYDRAAARARRAESHAPRPERARRAPVEEKSRIDADGVRTVKISGQATPPRRSGVQRRNAQRSLAVQIDRYDRRPDRAAQWALFMGVFMILVAIATGT